MTGAGAASGMPLTPRRAPAAYVRAEIASFPLTSLEAFRQAMVVLDPMLEDGGQGRVEEEKTRSLWTGCERELAQHASGWSLDRLIMARDFFWFGCRPDAPTPSRCAIPMQRYLRDLSGVYLEPYPGSTVLRRDFDTDSSDAATHYRWLTFALPEDLLLAASPGERAEPSAREVVLERPLLLQYLADRGVVEVHHHVGAGMSFSMLWASVMARLASPSLRPDEANSPGLPFSSGEVLLRWLLSAAVVRLILAEFLLQAPPEAQLDAFLEDRLRRSCWTLQRARALRQAMRALTSGADGELPDFYDLHELYAQLHPEADSLSEHPPETVEQVWLRCDPIASRLRLGLENGGERWLVRHGLEYLERRRPGALSGGPHRFSFRKLFWQVLRVRCLYYRTVVERPLTAGLQWFVRFYDRLGWARSPLDAARVEVSWDVAGRGKRLSALEARISPSPSPFSLAGQLLAVTRSWKRVLEKTGAAASRRGEPELGVILHFVKERDPKQRWAQGAPPAGESGSYAEPNPPSGTRIGGRFADFFSKRVEEARATAELLHSIPQLLWLVRGVDVASDELGVPTWVVIPLYRYLHHEAALASASREAEGAPPLRLTAHVGEDFRHLLEGLRRIFECVQYQLERFGGRLGHATALGVEPRLWAESAGLVTMSAVERLLDLVFEWRLYSGYRVAAELRAHAPPGRPEQLENKIRQLSKEIFSEVYEPQVMAEVHHVLHRLFCRPESRLPVEAGGLEAFPLILEGLDPDRLHNLDEVREILTSYQEDEWVFRRGQALVDVPLDEPEVQALYAVQSALRRGVGRRNIVVEVNPSSNLLIGDLMDLRNHPILRLFPPRWEEGAPPPVPIAVGSDDPVTFSTWLLHEYSLLYEAAVAAGYPDSVVQGWLEQIQRTGMDARFTVPWPPTRHGQRRADALCDALEDYLLHPRDPSFGRERRQ